MSNANPRRPRDPSQLAKMIVELATGEKDEKRRTPDDPSPAPETPEKNPAAVVLGRLGGLKGGKARAAKLSAEERTAIARKASSVRWTKT